MTKKIIVIAISVVLCLAVVGGCFALYKNDSQSLTFTFGSEAAVSLSLGTPEGVSFDFGGSKLSPTNKSVSQALVLDVSATNKNDMVGMSGELKVSITGDLESSVTLSCSATSTATPPVTVEYSQSQLAQGVILPLNDLPKNLSLTIALADDITDEQFAKIAGKSLKITVTWKAVNWAPENDAFYIVGLNNKWTITKDSVKFVPNPGNASELMATGVTMTKGESFKIVKCNTSLEDNRVWYGVGLKEGSNAGVSGGGAYDGGPNFDVETTGTYDLYFDGTNILYVKLAD